MRRDKTLNWFRLPGRLFSSKHSYIFEWSGVHGDIFWAYVCSVELFLVQTISSFIHFLFASTCPKTNTKIVLIFKKTRAARQICHSIYMASAGVLIEHPAEQPVIVFQLIYKQKAIKIRSFPWTRGDKVCNVVCRNQFFFTFIHYIFNSRPRWSLYRRFLVGNRNQKVFCVNLMHR